METNALYDIKFHTEVFFFYDFLILLTLLTSFVNKPQSRYVKHDFSGLFRDKMLRKKMEVFISKILPFAYIIIFFFLLSIRWDVFLYNREYLYIVNSKSLGITNPIMMVFHKSIPIIGILFFIILSITIAFRLKIYTLFIIPICTVLLLFEAAANSRATAMLLISSIPILILTKKRKYKYLSILIFGISVIFYNASIYGRGQSAQGLSQVASNLYFGNIGDNVSFIFILYNLFAGAVNLGTSMNLESHYPFLYKILSFSPTTSGIDNFSKLLVFENRINIYIPYGSFSEVYHFGLPFWIIGGLILLYVLIKSNIDVQRLGVIGYFIWLPLYLFIIASQQYPLRNYLRFVYISILISIVVNYYTNKIKKRKPSHET